MIVLMPHCGFLSETTRMLHIAQALQARGESVALATHGGPYLGVLQASGLPVTVLPPVADAARCAAFIRDLCRIGQPGVRLQTADEVRTAVAAEAQFLREQGARAVVIGFTLTAYLSSRRVGIPLVASHGGSYVPPVFERGLAPVPTTMPVPGTEWLPAWLKQRMANAGPHRMRGPVKFLNEIAAELGVEPVPSLAALMLGDLTLVTDVPEVLGVPEAALQAWRPNPAAAFRPDTRLTYVGPMFARLDVPVPPAVQPFLDGRVPTAYVVLSSATPERLREVTRQVRAAGPRVIVGATVHDFGPVDDPGIVVAGLLPSHEVMPRVDVAVIMGGQGTVQTAMTSGTPYVGIPLHPEQELNVDLGVRQGMALAMAPRHAGTERMTQAVAQVLATPAFRERALAVQRLYQGWEGPARAADAIRGLVAAPWRQAA